jgi:hypothetical protein
MVEGKGIVSKVQAKLQGDKYLGNNLLDYEELEISRGFLCCLSMTFEIMISYLKGFHLTLAAHLNQRDDE